MKALSRFLIPGTLFLALLVGMPSSASANTITVTSAGVTGTGPFVWAYTASEDSGGLIQTGAVPGITTQLTDMGSVTADYFTIYDFVGFTGVVTTPAGWAFESRLLGSTGSNVVVTDSGSISNLTWYYIGAPTVGPLTVTGFSATSTLGLPSLVHGNWASEDTQNGGGLAGHSNEAVGQVDTPGSVPEPASMLLLGSGLIGLAAKARRRLQRA
jgi:hypothetical protein